MSNNRITPFVKRMRTNGGTIYTFSSAVEDIGLNINERNNVVKISHFALLDVPPIQQQSSSKIVENRFNVTNLTGAFEYEQGNPSIKDGRVLIAESFQNYALNLESNLLNSADYNPTLVRTVSERVFWKWLKETGSIRWSKDTSVGSKQYWSEEIDADGSAGYNSVVKYVGLVSAGNVRTDSFGTYNETYILIPTSHGQTDAYFETIDDDNYYHGMEISPANPNENILGRGNYTLPHPDGLSYSAYYDFVDSSTQVVAPDGTWDMTYDNSTGIPSSGWWYTAEGREPTGVENTYFTDSSSYQTTGIYNVDLKYTKGGSTVEYKRSKVDCLSLVFNLDELKGIYEDTELTYDKMAIQYSVNDNFNFNAVLIYYTVYNSTMDEILGRNLLGVLFIDAPSGNSSNIPNDGIIIPSLEKIQSGPTGFGTSYSLRLNIKTDNMVDDTGATIVDMATSDQLYAEDWTAAFANLNTAVNLLTQNTGVIQNISEQYIEVQSTQTQIINDLQSLQYQVNDIGRDITGTPNALALFADGDDPLVDSSIYMKFGNVGIKNNLPQYPLHVSGTTKLDEVIIENAIRDTSGNILLGYGSPLQLGASTNYREVDVYTGNPLSAIHVDTSNNIKFRSDVSIFGNFSVDGSAKLAYLLVDKITSPSFNFQKSYIADTSVGTQFTWTNGFLEVIATTDVSASGTTGDIQFNSGGGLFSDPSLHYNMSTRRLGIETRDPSAKLHVIGNIYAGYQGIGAGHAITVGYGAKSNVYSGFNAIGDSTWTDWAATFGRNNGGANGSTLIGHRGTGNIQLYAPQNGGFYISESNVGIKTLPHSSIALSIAGDTSLGSNIYGKNISWNSSSRKLIINPGNTSPTLGSAQLGMANFAQGTAYEQDYLYSGHIVLGGGSSLAQYAMGTASKSYRGTNGTYTYTHMVVTDTGGFYTKYSANASDAAAAAGGTWRSHPYLSNGSSDRILTANSAVEINGESNLTFDGNLLKVLGNIAVRKNTAAYSLDVSGNINFDGSIFRNGIEIGTGAVSAINNNADNRILTATGGSSINGESNLIFDGDYLGVGVTPAYRFHIRGNHNYTQFLMNASTGAGESTDADLFMWASEPGETYTGVGIANNRMNIGGFPRISTARGGSYMRLLDEQIWFSNISNSGVENIALKISGSTLDVSGNLNFPAASRYIINLGNDADTGFYWDNANRYLEIRDDSVARFRFNIDTGQLDVDDNVVAYSSSISDIRLKENIQKLENPLEKILQIEGISYTRKKTGDKHFGVIAQEIEKIIPEIIVETPLLMETGDEETLYKTVKYTELIPYLIESIKAQQKMIDELREEIYKLKK
jgi:hypothetical protein